MEFFCIATHSAPHFAFAEKTGVGSHIESGATTLSLRSSAGAERVVADWGPLPLKWADSGAGAPAGTPLTPLF